MAVSADGASWFLVQASPEIRQQIEDFSALWPRPDQAGVRQSPVAGLLLGNGDLDHCLGLLSLREGQPLDVYTTRTIARGFCEANVLYRTLQRFPEQVRWHMLPLGVETPLTVGREPEVPSGLTVTALPVSGKRPLHLEGLEPPSPEENVAFRIRDTHRGTVLAYASTVGALDPRVRMAVTPADAVFFDGTFWSSDELQALGIAPRTAEQLAHWPVGGPTGSLGFLAELPRGTRRILIHLNNTNPLLREDSPERASVTAAGLEVAYDGMEGQL